VKTGDKIRTAVLWKYVAKVSVLFFGLALSLSTYAVGDGLVCTKYSNIHRYNGLMKYIKNEGSNDAAAYHGLAFVSLCLGKEEEGMAYLQKAVDMGDVSATILLGLYYVNNQTFDTSQTTENGENLNAAIHYYKKAADLIENNSNYPDRGMEEHEQKYRDSYRVFTTLPSFYFNGYSSALGDIVDSGEDSYSDTLTVLKSMETQALRCLRRPALSVWKENKDIIYEAQQISCGAALDFARDAYPLERERIRVAENCEVPLGECSEHQEILDSLIPLAQRMFTQKELGRELLKGI